MVELGEMTATRPQGQWALAWRRLKRDRLAVGCGILLLVILFAVGPGARLYAKAIGHGPNDLFPYSVSVGLRPAGPFTVTYATSRLADDQPFAFHHTPPPDGTPKTLLLLGADSQLGRDEFLRILYGGRVSLEVAIGGSPARDPDRRHSRHARWVLRRRSSTRVISRFTELVMAFPCCSSS